MSDRQPKPKTNWNKRSFVLGCFSFFVTTVLAGVGLIFASRSSPNTSMIVQNITTWINSQAQPVHTTVPSEQLSTQSPSSMAIASTSADVTLRAAPGDVGIEVTRAPFAYHSGNNVYIVIHIASPRATWKIAATEEYGWSLTAQSGKQCGPGGALNGLLTFYTTGSDQHYIELMQNVSPDGTLTANISGYCNQPIVASDRFVLSGRLVLFPSTAVPGNDESRHPRFVNFSGDDIPLK